MSLENNTTSLQFILETANSLPEDDGAGKALVAQAITDKGVPTASSATLETMAANITAIPEGAQVKIGTFTASRTSSVAVSGLGFTPQGVIGYTTKDTGPTSWCLQSG